MSWRQRLLHGTERLLALGLVGLIAGTTLAFGGAVWWAGPVIAVLTFLVVLAWLAHVLLTGRMAVLKSPLAALGVLVLGLAVGQLAPLPEALATRLSPRSRQVYTLGALADRVRADDPTAEAPEAPTIRSPVALDRSATLQWLAGATACLALFWVVSQFTDRLERLYLIWGSIVAGFFLNGAIAVVQLLGRVPGIYGYFEPGKGAWWAPSALEWLSRPNAAALRLAADPGASGPLLAAWQPDRPFLLGTLMGGPGAYLALGSLGLPLGLALVLQLLAPRGSREALGARLGASGQGGVVGVMSGLLVLSAVLVGFLAGPLLSVPFALAVVLVGLPSAWPTGLRWLGLGLTALTLAGLGAGVGLASAFDPATTGLPAGSARDLARHVAVWRDALAIARDFPIAGVGLGGFATIYPFYKSSDEAQTTALSSLVQWVAESGAIGLALLALAAVWCLCRLPGAVRRVGSADRALVFGLIGAAAGFTLYSAVQWTVELSAVALAASAWGGTWNRWLAGGTDLFVERG